VLEHVTSVTGGHSVLVLQAYAYTKYLGKYHGYTWGRGGGDSTDCTKDFNSLVRILLWRGSGSYIFEVSPRFTLP
jgi:hypothetical protein